MSAMRHANIQRIRFNDPLFFSVMAEFIYCPAAYLHPSHRQNFFEGSVPDYVWNSQRTWPRLSSLILSEMRLSEEIGSFPTEKYWAFLYLPVNKMRRLAHHIGAILLGSKIRASLARAEVLLWKDRLGPETFDFVMNRARLLPFVENGTPSGGDDIEKIGYGIIVQCLDELPESVKARAILKTKLGSIQDNIESRHARQLLQSLAMSLEPEWHSLFEKIEDKQNLTALQKS